MEYANVATADSKASECAIERRDASGLSYEDFLVEYAMASRPVIIENSVPHWNALRTWTPEFFAETYGDERVLVTDGLTMRFADFVEAARASSPENPAPYLHKLIIHRDLPALLPDVTPGNVFGFPGRLASPLMPKPWNRPDGYLKLLFGGVGGKFPFAHYDSDNAYALITGIYGRKEFLLFSPSEGANVYPKPDAANVSSIPDLSSVDLNRFPRFARAVAHRGTIGPSDAIFIPNRWWHAARVVDVSISVCTNMINAVNWRGFVDETCRAMPGRSRPRQFAKRIFLSAVGTSLSAVERFRSQIPLEPVVNVVDRIAPRYENQR